VGGFALKLSDLNLKAEMKKLLNLFLFQVEKLIEGKKMLFGKIFLIKRWWNLNQNT